MVHQLRPYGGKKKIAFLNHLSTTHSHTRPPDFLLQKLYHQDVGERREKDGSVEEQGEKKQLTVRWLGTLLKLPLLQHRDVETAFLAKPKSFSSAAAAAGGDNDEDD